MTTVNIDDTWGGSSAEPRKVPPSVELRKVQQTMKAITIPELTELLRSASVPMMLAEHEEMPLGDHLP